MFAMRPVSRLSAATVVSIWQVAQMRSQAGTARHQGASFAHILYGRRESAPQPVSASRQGWRPAHAAVNPCAAIVSGSLQIASINHDRITQPPGNLPQIEATRTPPLRENQQRIRARPLSYALCELHARRQRYRARCIAAGSYATTLQPSCTSD